MPRLRAITIAAPSRPKTRPRRPRPARPGSAAARRTSPPSSDGEVERGEARVAERRLDHAPEPEQRVHVQARCGTAPRAGSRRSAAATTRRRPTSGPHEHEVAARRRCRPALRPPDAEEHQHVDRDQHVGRRSARPPSSASCAPASSAASTPGSACRPASPSCSRGRSGCRSSSRRRRSRGPGGGSRWPSRGATLAAVPHGLSSQDRSATSEQLAGRLRRAAVGLVGDQHLVDALHRAGHRRRRRAVAARREQRRGRLGRVAVALEPDLVDAAVAAARAARAPSAARLVAVELELQRRARRAA